jgi:hypothetical protein
MPASSGDFNAARARGGEVLAAVLALRKSHPARRCDNADAHAAIAPLVETTRWYADAVKREASDNAVQVTLKTAHDNFMPLVSCMTAAAAGAKSTH